MLKRFRKNKPDQQVLKKRQHGINKAEISQAACEIVKHLSENGYEAYVVGGCLRDAIMGLHPKDFDVATSATPEQVVKLFPRSRIIGRRFKIVHVRRGRELIEVTTFRGHHESGGGKHAQQAKSGLLVRDNVYGDLEADALRRDFTCNSLYYDPQKELLIDRCNGVADMRNGILRTIGDPWDRFCEDPVRMIRAVRFEAKLGLALDEASQEALEQNRHMMQEVAPARLFDEMIKVLMQAHALDAFNMLYDTGLFEQLFPGPFDALENGPDYLFEMMQLAMRNTETRIAEDKGVAPFFLYSVLLWPAVKIHYDEFIERGIAPADAMRQAGDIALQRQVQRITIPRRFSTSMQDVWFLQTALERITPKRAARTAEHPRFRAGYDFLLLREEGGEQLNDLGQWWTDYQKANPQQKSQMVNQKSGGNSDGKRRRRRRPRGKGGNQGNSSE